MGILYDINKHFWLLIASPLHGDKDGVSYWKAALTCAKNPWFGASIPCGRAEVCGVYFLTLSRCLFASKIAAWWCLHHMIVLNIWCQLKVNLRMQVRCEVPQAWWFIPVISAQERSRQLDHRCEITPVPPPTPKKWYKQWKAKNCCVGVQKKQNGFSLAGEHSSRRTSVWGYMIWQRLHARGKVVCLFCFVFWSPEISISFFSLS